MQQGFKQLSQALSANIIGQQHLIERLLIALLADGHLLVEGAPGLAKTKAINALADHIEGDFKRIQFTPDLLPGDITGTEIYRPEEGSFKFQQGPIFHNLILADEINRAPAKVQSALLEAMGERQVSVGGNTMKLEKLFLVMATQNPIEQEGTYPLPEAQLDRFLMHVVIDYGASPRGTIALERCARAHAWLNNRDFVSPDDVQAIAHDVLRHRILLSFEAEASGMTTNKVINELITRVPVA